jgi:3-dehydroquinate dehydratase type I
MNTTSSIHTFLILLTIHTTGGWSFQENLGTALRKQRTIAYTDPMHPVSKEVSSPPSASFVKKLHSTHSDQINSKNVKRNIFHEYSKPIVLIGCSSARGQELLKLSHSFHSTYTTKTSNEVVHVTPDNMSTILQSISSNDLRWPTILILDVGGSWHDFNTEQLEQAYVSLLKEIYEEYDMISVYVNVHSSTSSELALKKKKLDDKLFKYSDYEICISDEDVDNAENWEHIVWEFRRLLARSRLLPAIPGDKKRTINTAHLTMGLHTFFLSLTFPDIRQVAPYVEQMCKDVDAMEYRADLLQCRESRFDVIYGMQLLRKFCRPFVVRAPALPFGDGMIEDLIPIVFTVRTASQAGTFPDDEDGITKMYEMLEWGLRSGAEVLDIESAWDFVKTARVLKLAEERYSSQILGSHHVVGKEIEMEDAVGLFEQCALNGRAHGAKVVLSIDSDKKDRMAYEAALIATELAEMDEEPVIPNIALILGDVGQFSQRTR